MADPHVTMAEIDLPPRVPRGLDEFLEFTTEFFFTTLRDGNLPLTLMTFGVEAYRIWHLHDVEAVDDVLRAIVAEEKPLGLAFVFRAPVPSHVPGNRATILAVEDPTGSVQRCLIFDHPVGQGDGSGRRMDRRPESQRWFGVEPDREVAMWYQGLAGMNWGNRPPDA